jgi:hypothetical protein
MLGFILQTRQLYAELEFSTIKYVLNDIQASKCSMTSCRICNT